MRHSQSPWYVSEFEKTVDSRMVMSTDGYSVAFCDGRTFEENIANANLISSAPQLLDCLVRVRFAAESLPLLLRQDIDVAIEKARRGGK